MNRPPRSRTACRFLPPEGAAAPAARRSRFRGPCLGRKAPTVAHGVSLPAPRGGPLRLRSGEASPAAPAWEEKTPAVAHGVSLPTRRGALGPLAPAFQPEQICE